MQTLVNWLIPNNCRVELHAAAAHHLEVCTEVVCLLIDHKEKVTKEIVRDKNRAA